MNRKQSQLNPKKPLITLLALMFLSGGWVLGINPLAYGIPGGTGSDISGGNGSDISGGNGSDISGGTGSDNSGGDGTGVSREFIRSLLDLLRQFRACGSSCTLSNLAEIRQGLVNLQQICEGGCGPGITNRLNLVLGRVDAILNSSSIPGDSDSNLE